jgi:hypothetical protein
VFSPLPTPPDKLSIPLILEEMSGRYGSFLKRTQI